MLMNLRIMRLREALMMMMLMSSEQSEEGSQDYEDLKNRRAEWSVDEKNEFAEIRKSSPCRTPSKTMKISKNRGLKPSNSTGKCTKN